MEKKKLKRARFIKSFKIICLLIFVCYSFGYSQQANPKKLIGNWNWIQSSGGFAGQIINPKTTGYDIQIEFTKNGLYKEGKDKKIDHQYKYRIKLGKTIYSQEPTDIIKYISPSDSKEEIISDSFEFKGKDTLILKNECRDCFIKMYVRRK